MSSSRLRLLGITAAVFILAICVVFFMVREIFKQSELLEQQVTTLQKDRDQQTQLSQLKRLLEETETDRDAVAGYYLQSQSDSIDFLNYVESLAADAGVQLSTEGASETSRENTELLTVQYEVSSNLPSVERFVQLLESIPYVSGVTALQLSQQSATVWSAAITIEVAILEYETTI